jgi:hypothetical protein
MSTTQSGSDKVDNGIGEQENQLASLTEERAGCLEE